MSAWDYRLKVETNFDYLFAGITILAIARDNPQVLTPNSESRELSEKPPIKGAFEIELIVSLILFLDRA